MRAEGEGHLIVAHLDADVASSVSPSSLASSSVALRGRMTSILATSELERERR